MKAYLCKFEEEFFFPDDACVALEQAYDAIVMYEDIKNEFRELLKCYDSDMNYPFCTLLDCMAKISAKVSLHEYTGHLLLVICMSKILKRYYNHMLLAE